MKAGEPILLICNGFPTVRGIGGGRWAKFAKELVRRMGASIRVEEVKAELPKIIRGERVIEVDKHTDHSAYLLPNVTDRLIAEVLA